MGWLEALVGGGAGFLTGGWPGAAAGALSGYSAGQSADAAKAAGNQAQQLSNEQRALLQQILQWGNQYGTPLLQKSYEWATNPYETPYERVLRERTRQDIEKSYRPAYAKTMQGLSNRGMLNPYNSVLPSYTASLDRARGGAVANMYMQEKANAQNEEGNRLQAFSNLLSQLRGGNVSGAGAYSQPISTYAGLAQQAGASAGSTIGSLIQWLIMQSKKNQNTGTPVTSPYLGTGGQTSLDWLGSGGMGNG